MAPRLRGRGHGTPRAASGVRREFRTDRRVHARSGPGRRVIPRASEGRCPAGRSVPGQHARCLLNAAGADRGNAPRARPVRFSALLKAHGAGAGDERAGGVRGARMVAGRTQRQQGAREARAADAASMMPLDEGRRLAPWALAEVAEEVVGPHVGRIAAGAVHGEDRKDSADAGCGDEPVPVPPASARRSGMPARRAASLSSPAWRGASRW